MVTTYIQWICDNGYLHRYYPLTDNMQYKETIDSNWNVYEKGLIPYVKQSDHFRVALRKHKLKQYNEK